MQVITNRSIRTVMKGLALLGCSLSFWPYLVEAGTKGMESGDYSHVFVIPLIALVVYLRAPRSESLPPNTTVVGILLACGILLRAVGEWQNWPLAAMASFPLLFIGFTELFFGHGEARRIAFPALFLLFAFGFVTDVMLKLFANYLVLLSTGAAYDAATTFLPEHGPYILAGNMVIVPPGARFDVVEACSGVRATLGLFVIGSLVGHAKKLTWRPALRFLLLLAVGSVAANLFRIGATIISSLLLKERFTHGSIHDFWNILVFGSLILSTPLLAGWANRMRVRFGLVNILALAMILTHVVHWHMRASEGNTRVVVRQTTPESIHQATLEVDQHGIPSVLLPYVSPVVDGHRHWRWLLTSALVHSNVSHLAVNVALLLLLAHAIRHDLRWPWTAAILLAGQVAGSLAGWLTWQSPEGMEPPAFVGSSCAVSGLFGAYVVSHLLTQRKWMQAVLLLAIYVAGIWLAAGNLGTAYGFSHIAHFAGLATGMTTAGIHALTAGRERKGQDDWMTG